MRFLPFARFMIMSLLIATHTGGCRHRSPASREVGPKRPIVKIAGFQIARDQPHALEVTQPALRSREAFKVAGQIEMPSGEAMFSIGVVSFHDEGKQEIGAAVMFPNSTTGTFEAAFETGVGSPGKHLLRIAVLESEKQERRIVGEGYVTINEQ